MYVKRKVSTGLWNIKYRILCGSQKKKKKMYRNKNVTQNEKCIYFYFILMILQWSRMQKISRWPSVIMDVLNLNSSMINNIIVIIHEKRVSASSISKDIL